MRDFGALLAIMFMGTLFAGGLVIGNGALTVSGLLLLGLFTVIGLTGLKDVGSRLIRSENGNSTPPFLIPLVGMGLVSASGFLILGGLVWENGVLTVIGMLLVGITLVGVLRPRRTHEARRTTGNNKSLFPVAFVLLVSLAGTLIAFGLQQQAGILTVIGMLAVGLFTVVGLSKASRYV